MIRMIHRQRAGRANLFLIGGKISAFRPGSIIKALRFARETGLDVFISYYPLCMDYLLTRAYEMIHAAYKEMPKDYAPERISVLGTSSGGNLALGTVPYINDGHGVTPIPAASWPSPRAPAWTRTRNGSACRSWTGWAWPSRRNT